MQFITYCSRGLINTHFVLKRSFSVVRTVHIRKRNLTCLIVHNKECYTSTVPRISASNSLEKQSTKRAKVLLQCARPMSQFTRGDVDEERMHQALQQSSQPQRTEDDGSRLIYQLRGLGMMRFCTVFFYITSLTGLYMAPDIISSSLAHDSLSGEMLVGFATIIMAVGVLPTLLLMFNRRLVLRLYYNEARKSYLAMTQSPLLTLRRREFRHEDVVPSKTIGTILGLFSLNTLKAKGDPYYVNPYNFKVPSDYNHLMGYDKIQTLP